MNQASNDHVFHSVVLTAISRAPARGCREAAPALEAAVLRLSWSDFQDTTLLERAVASLTSLDGLQASRQKMLLWGELFGGIDFETI